MNLLATRLAPAFAWLGIIILLIAVMHPGLRGAFLFDDHPNIVDNQAIHLQSLSLESLHSSLSGPTAGPLGRPVSVLSFALTHYFFGLDPFAFKAINLLIHAINGVLVAWLVKLLLQNLRSASLSEKVVTWLPIWVAAVWVVHPINVVAIMMAVQRMTLLSATFMLLALVCHVKGGVANGKQKWGWLAAGWLIFWPMSIFSKESGILFPLYVAVIAYFSQSAKESTSSRKSWVLPTAVLVFIAIVTAMLLWLGLDWLDATYAVRPFTLTERLMTEARVLWFYIAQIVIPNPTAFGLYLDDFAISKSLVAPVSTLLSIVAWSGVIIAIAFWRQHLPAFGFAAAWFLAGHSMESTILPLEIAHEHRNYLPLIGVLIGLGYLAMHVSHKLRTTRLITAISLAAPVYILVLALFTWMRADLLGNPLVGPLIEAERHPLSARANHAAAVALMRVSQGDRENTFAYQQVSYYLLQTNKADPSFKYGALTLILWTCALNHTVEQQWVDTLAHRLEHTPFGPGEQALPGEILRPLSKMPECLKSGDAVRFFNAGASNPRLNNQLRARFLEAASDYILLTKGDLSDALPYMAKAVNMSPEPALMRKLEHYENVKRTANIKHKQETAPVFDLHRQ